VTRWAVREDSDTDADLSIHDTQDEAIEAWSHHSFTPHPAEITLVGYERATINTEDWTCGVDSAGLAWGGPLGNLLDLLDNEVEIGGGSSRDVLTTTATAAMLAAERAFVEAVIAEYEVWHHEETGETVTVNLHDWCHEKTLIIAERVMGWRIAQEPCRCR